eukprot:746981-Hanusia_phi.AAC.3
MTPGGLGGTAGGRTNEQGRQPGKRGTAPQTSQAGGRIGGGGGALNCAGFADADSKARGGQRVS